jgi:hypothetical protein
MAVITDTVNPGDVISSALMRQIIDMLNAHDAALGGGGTSGITVPNLFGRTIAEARVSLQLQQLALGTVVDTGGNIINALGALAQSLMVLSQVPVAGAQTQSGAAVSLVVAGSGGGSPPPPAPPAITLLVPSSQRALASLEIRGSGFAGTTSTVTIGGINATVLGTSNQTRVFVTVPNGIPGAPSLPGDPAASGIAVRLTNPDSAFATSTVTILPPLASPLGITSITPDPATVGVAVTINGTGFSATAGQNTVSFGGVPATPTTASTTQLSVVVPTGIPGLVAPGDSTTVNVTVTRTTDSVTSGAVPLSIDF